MEQKGALFFIRTIMIIGNNNTKDDKPIRKGR
jgi:hypothetical protein